MLVICFPSIAMRCDCSNFYSIYGSTISLSVGVCVWKHVYTYFLWCIFSAILQRVCWQFPGTWFASITIYFFPPPLALSSTWVRKRQEAEKVYSFRCVYFVYYSFYYCFLFCVLPFALSEEVSRSNYFLELVVVVVAGTRMWRTYVVHTQYILTEQFVLIDAHNLLLLLQLEQVLLYAEYSQWRIVFCLLFYSLFQQQNKQSLQKGGGASRACMTWLWL